MASAVAEQCWLARNSLKMWDHDPDGTDATITTPDAGTTKRVVDMKGFKRFVAAAMAKPLTGSGITKLEIVAAANEAMSTNLTVVKDSGTIAADAVGDWAVQECSADELAQLSSDAGLAVGAGLRYVAARLTVQNSADEATVVYIATEPTFAYKDLTPATTIA